MTFKRALRCSFSLSVAFPLALGLGACKGGGASQATPAASGESSSAQTSASVSAAPRADVRPHPRELPGPVGTLFRAARDLELTDAQKTTLDGLETKLASNAEPGHDEAKELQTDLVAGIRAGKIDQAKLKADFAAADKDMAAQQAKEADALSGLYAALDATERKAVVAAVRTKQAARDAQFAQHNIDVDAGAADWAKRRLERMTQQLNLDAAQQKTVGALLAKGDSMSPAAMAAQREEGKKRMDRVLNAFDGDTFDAKKLDLGAVPGSTMHEGLEKDTAFLSQLVPILTPDQREKLASQREHGGGAFRRRPGGMGGMGGPGAMGGPGGGPSNE